MTRPNHHLTLASPDLDLSSTKIWPMFFQERRKWWNAHVKVVGWGVDGPQFDIIKDESQDTEKKLKDEF